MYKRSKGITLIALVITIIVLLILAGVSIMTLAGDNGLLTRTTTAKQKTEEAGVQEELQTAIEALKVDYYSSGATGTIGAYISDHESDLQSAVGDSTLEVDGSKVTYKGYDFTVDETTGKITGKEISTAATKPEKETITDYPEWTKLNKVSKNGGFDQAKGVNMPKLGNQLTAVILTSEKDSGVWYDYTAQTGTTDGKTTRWGNAVTTETSTDANENTVVKTTGFYVWIPRYAYKITSGNHGDGLSYTDNVTTGAGTIDVKFLKNATNEFADGTGTAGTGSYTDWIVHPAFTFGTTELTGIWVAKYEMSAFIDNGQQTTRNLGSITGEQTIKLASLPEVESAENLTIGTMYDLSKGLNSTLESHLLKNSEWGAVAYLAHSKYGRNETEVSINSQTYTGQGNESKPFTGGTDGKNNVRYYIDKVTQSTTGNAYGIYDLNGGKSEYVAAYVNNGNDNLTNYGKSSINNSVSLITADAKYKDVYTVGTNNTNNGDGNNYDANSGVKGDAVYETSKNGNGQSSWFSDYSYFPYSSSPFFLRGGGCNDGVGAGLFCFYNLNGGANNNNSFRVALVVV